MKFSSSEDEDVLTAAKKKYYQASFVLTLVQTFINKKKHILFAFVLPNSKILLIHYHAIY